MGGSRGPVAFGSFLPYITYEALGLYQWGFVSMFDIVGLLFAFLLAIRRFYFHHTVEYCLRGTALPPRAYYCVYLCEPACE